MGIDIGLGLWVEKGRIGMLGGHGHGLLGGKGHLNSIFNGFNQDWDVGWAWTSG